jgi:hypothetical protein
MMKISPTALLKLAFVLCFVFSFSHSASALDFKLHPNNKSKTLTAILATGTIEKGDTQFLRTFFRSLPPRKNAAIYLASGGGNLYEGMRLGTFFRESRIKTVIEGGEECASACALAFLGGTDNKGMPWRSSSTNSRLGFHAFSRASPEDVSMDEVQNVVSKILAYGKSVKAPVELLIVGFATPSKGMFVVSNSDICDLGIKLWSVETKKFVCGN